MRERRLPSSVTTFLGRRRLKRYRRPKFETKQTPLNRGSTPSRSGLPWPGFHPGPWKAYPRFTGQRATETLFPWLFLIHFVDWNRVSSRVALRRLAHADPRKRGTAAACPLTIHCSLSHQSTNVKCQVALYLPRTLYFPGVSCRFSPFLVSFCHDMKVLYRKTCHMFL